MYYYTTYLNLNVQNQCSSFTQTLSHTQSLLKQTYSINLWT